MVMLSVGRFEVFIISRIQKKLRDSYDTYKVIDSLSESGFKPVSVLENSITVTNIEASKISGVRVSVYASRSRFF